MAVCRAIFDAGLGFDPGVGPDGSKAAYGMGGESEFVIAWPAWASASGSTPMRAPPIWFEAVR